MPLARGDKTLSRPGDKSGSSGGSCEVKTWSCFPGPGVTATGLSWWRDQFLGAGRAVCRNVPRGAAA